MDDKHSKYYSEYQPNDEFWGIGIEQEVYLEFSEPKIVEANFLFRKPRPERYSVNYFNVYPPDMFLESLRRVIGPVNNHTKIYLPLLLNAHSFQKTDINNQPEKTWEKVPKPNPNFSKSLFDFLKEKDSYFSEKYNQDFLFDGDTIEFATKKFYKSTIQDVIEELLETKQNFITHLQYVFEQNKIFNFGKIGFARCNHPLSIFMTNLERISIFNNMTYHFNFTYPTKLNENCEIADKEKFIKQHKNLIRVLQWVSPLLIAVYGSGDFLSKDPNIRLTKSSQRCAISRYIGVGTYDTENMPEGKILSVKRDPIHGIFYTKDKTEKHSQKSDDKNIGEISNSWTNSWYDIYYRESDYIQLSEIGLDFNFQKFKNHGIEFRIFDWFPENKLEEVLTFIVSLMDHAKKIEVTDPRQSPEWNRFVADVILYGKNIIIKEKWDLYKKVFPSFSFSGKMNLEKFYIELRNWSINKYKNKECSKKFIRKNPKKFWCC